MGTTGGKGGGRPDFAQAGGKDKDKIYTAMQEVQEFVKGMLMYKKYIALDIGDVRIGVAKSDVLGMNRHTMKLLIEEK